MKIALGSDHAGFQLKEEIKVYIEGLGHEVEDFGCFSPESVDYPEIGFEVAKAVADGRYDRGILICGTGVGMSMVANKVRGIRASLCNDLFTARAAREHNNANVLAMGARVIGSGVASEIVKVWLSTEFAGGRHARRVDKIGLIEAKGSC